MSDDHKTALAIGRAEGRAVRRYLDALEANKPKRGRKRTKDTIENRLAQIDIDLADADSVNRVKLIQERIDLTGELAGMDEGVDMSELESEFVAVAKSYSARQGISYATWREIGVDAAVLKRAGIARGE